MAKPEIRAVKKNSNKSKESSQKQETKTNESPSQKQAQPDQSSSEPANPFEHQSSSSRSETLQKPKESAYKPAVAEESSSSSEQEQQSNEQQKEPAEANQETTTRFFQAVGIIEGEVSFDEQGQAKVTVSGKTYPLLYIPKQKYKLLALQKRIRETGNPVKRLIVYPRAIHFPDKNKPQQIQFQLLKFEEEAGSKLVISQNLANMEFQIAGLWQFIPVCRVPCISVFKNATPERLEWIKQANIQSRVKFMKPAHLPVLWKQAPVKPFKYNPRAENQEKPAFVKIKAKFLPNKDAFGFDSLLEAPMTENIPKYLKASKTDKQQALQKQIEPTNSQSSEPHQNGSQPAQEQEMGENKLSFDETIHRIANQINNKEEIAKQSQGKQAQVITNQLTAHRLKDENYSLPKNYISNWKYGKNIPNQTGKHYSAYRLWQLIIGN